MIHHAIQMTGRHNQCKSKVRIVCAALEIPSGVESGLEQAWEDHSIGLLSYLNPLRLSISLDVIC
jgi:hypothetical protein